jgi:hypothetical protein
MGNALKLDDAACEEPERGANAFGYVWDELFETKERFDTMIDDVLRLGNTDPGMQQSRDLHIELMGLQAAMARASRELTKILVWKGTSNEDQNYV